MRKILPLSLALFSALNADSTRLGEIYVIGEKSILDTPNQVEIIGKNTLLESNDIAKSFSKLPGFSMLRKGGGGSEILYRSQMASRLPVVIDGGLLHGGCGGRMDTPITYISAENYKSIKIVKGPQDVRFASLIAGGVLFNREITRFDKFTYGGNLNLLYGSFAHTDASANAVVGNEIANLAVFGGYYESDDYKDGSGKSVHSAYERKNGSFIATFTPSENTAIELSGDFGKGEAAYAHGMMDGSAFDRQSLNLKLEQKVANHTLNFQIYEHKINHIMDNYSLRKPAMKFNVSNPKRQIRGVRFEDIVALNESKIYFGTQFYNDLHQSRASSGNMSANQANKNLKNAKFSKNFKFETLSFFAQGDFLNFENSGIFAGARIDKVDVKKYKATPYEFTQNAPSGFLRYESYLDNLTLYSGIAHASRVADFWELNRTTKPKELDVEKNTQIDLGAVYKGENANFSLNLFGAKINDYILIDWTNSKAFNTNAMLLGGEIEGDVKFFDILKLASSLSYTYGRNLKTTNGLNSGDALPQISPLSANFEIGLEKPDWFVKTEISAYKAQNRIAKNYGSVGGFDTQKSSGFSVINLYGGYKYQNAQILLGVENLTDKKHAYHVSRIDADIYKYGYANDERIYEPGRNFWLKFKAHF